MIYYYKTIVGLTNFSDLTDISVEWLIPKLITKAAKVNFDLEDNSKFYVKDILP